MNKILYEKDITRKHNYIKTTTSLTVFKPVTEIE